MFKFYLRQTVPFNLLEFFLFPFLFFIKKYHSIDYVERKIKEKIGTKYSIVTSSMRDGLIQSLSFFNKKYPLKNELILPEYSFHSNLSSVLNLGLKVRYAPVDPETLEINLKKLPKYINNKTLGIIITHMHGLAYPMEKLVPIIKKNKLLLFEDCAHVFGNKYKNKCLGSFSEVGCFSFGPGKNITSFGGGAICTNNFSLYHYLKMLQIKNNNLLENLKTYCYAIIYTLISNPIFSFFTIKPALKVLYLLNIKRNKHDKFKLNNKYQRNIKIPNSFQLNLLSYQLDKIYERIEKIIEKRKMIANFYDIFFGKNNKNIKNNYYFQYPVKTNNQHSLINKSWKQNLDIQTDYCNHLPNLYKSNKLDLKLNSNIVYLPVNYHISLSILEKKLLKIFKK